MKFLKLFFLFLISTLYLKSMSEDLTSRLENSTISMDSDSESESELNYDPFSTFLFEDIDRVEDNYQEYYVLFRGIHFFPEKFKTKNDRKKFFQESCSSIDIKSDSSELILFDDSNNKNSFFALYKNQYDNFIKKYKKNPIISTTELINKAFNYSYASNGYIATNDSIPLKPAYNRLGRPTRPYLGALYIILISTERFNDLDKFSYLNEYIKNNDLKINSRKYQDHEIAFLNIIPGEFVCMVLPVRVPNFSKPYKEKYYLPKYGFTANQFEKFKILAINGNIELIIKSIIEYKSKEILKFLKEKKIKFGYEAPDGTFLKQPLRVGNRNIRTIRKNYN